MRSGKIAGLQSSRSTQPRNKGRPPANVESILSCRSRMFLTKSRKGRCVCRIRNSEISPSSVRSVISDCSRHFRYTAPGSSARFSAPDLLEAKKCGGFAGTLSRHGRLLLRNLNYRWCGRSRPGVVYVRSIEDQKVLSRLTRSDSHFERHLVDFERVVLQNAGCLRYELQKLFSGRRFVMAHCCFGKLLER